jgi:antitoxin component HigA of HigAB toxin-antitoxin module
MTITNSKFNMPLKNYKRVIGETPDEVNTFVETSMDILERIHELLDQKFEGKQKLLAEKLGKSEAEVSKMLNGVQNFTVKTITRLEWAFGARIIAVCTDDLMAAFIPVKMPAAIGFRRITLAERGAKTEHFEGMAIKSTNATASKTTYSAS